MSLEGMDVDQAQLIAQRLGGYARALSEITAALATLTAELSHSWHGSASATFQQQWTTAHQAALGSAVQAMADMHAHLVANIQQQVQASAPGPGPGPGQAPGTGVTGTVFGGLAITAILGGVRRAWRVAETVEGYESLVTTPLEKIEEIAGNDDVADRYDKLWSRLIQLDGDGPLLKYKSSPILHWLHDNPHVQQADELLVRAHVPDVLDKLGKVSTGMFVLSSAASVAQAITDVRQRDYASAGGQAVDLTAGLLKNSRNPVLYLAGIDISLAQKDVELARQIQWSQGIPNPFDPGVFENDYVPTFRSLPGQLVSTLAEIF